MMDPNGREDAALGRALREVREEPTPDVDWDRLEARLMERVESSHAAEHAPAAWRWALPLAAAAAVVLVSLGLMRGESHEPVAAVAPPGVVAPRTFGPDVSGNVDGNRLAVGDLVVSADREVTVDHPGRAAWTLADSSRVSLAESGEKLVLRLHSGAVLSRVVPSERPETFAVLVDNVRVAVHGTVFRVERTDERALVAVSEGVVSVGPADNGATEGWMLRAGDQGSFTLDGKQGTVQRAPTAQLEPVTVEGIVPKPHAAKRPPAAALPRAPTTAELEQRLDGVAARVSSCFERHTKTGDVRVMARTRLTARVQPDGSVGSLGFDPPLAPDVQACIAGVERTKFPPSQQGAVVERSILLGP